MITNTNTHFLEEHAMNVSPAKKYAALPLFVALLLGAAGAQQSAAQTSQQNSQKSAAAAPAAPAAPVAGVIPLGVTRIEADLVAPGLRASKLMKQKVYNDAGQKIGEIEDLVIAPDGSLSVGVVEVGGFLGIGKHRVAIPVKQFTQIHPKVVLPGATKEALKKLPEFIPA
jgi:sporulation protein YlmC with PRC-barrel domain